MQTYAVLDATFESPSREQQLSVLIPFDAEVRVVLIAS